MPRSTSIDEFTHRAKTTLRREKDSNVLLKQWEERIADYHAAGLTIKHSTIYASLEFLCLTRIINEYDFDEIVSNRPVGTPSGRKPAGPRAKASAHVDRNNGHVTCKGIDQSHRENLRWAINKAGEFRRTGQAPGSCPNDAAWWLYEQAVSDPKDFLTKYNQIEGRSDDEAEAMRKARYTGEQSIAEINQMLAALEKEEDEDAE